MSHNLTSAMRALVRAPARCSGAVLLVAGLVLAACGGGDDARRTEDGSIVRGAHSVVAARVDGESIFVTDVLVEATRRGLIEPGEELDAGSDEFYLILQELVETKLLAKEAESRGLDKTIDGKHRLEAARTVVLAGLLDEHLQEKLLDEQELRKFYEKNVKTLNKAPLLVHARHIQVANQDAALAAKTRLDRGEPFEAVAFEMSVDRVTGGDGGDLGFRAPESFPQPLQEAILKTEEGKVAGPIESEFGWHLVKVEERRKREPPSYEAMRPRLVEQMYWEKLREVIDQLREDAKVELFIDERTPGVGPRPGLAAPEDGPAPLRQAPPPQQQTRNAAPAPPQASRPAQATAAARPQPTPKPAEAAAAAPRPTPQAAPKPTQTAAAPPRPAPTPAARPAPKPAPKPVAAPPVQTGGFVLPPDYQPGDVIITPDGQQSQ